MQKKWLAVSELQKLEFIYTKLWAAVFA